jgi:fatty-acyl-CoA synthase
MSYAEFALTALRRYPDKTAFRYDAGLALSYRDVAELTAGAARVLTESGFGRGDGMVILGGSSPYYFPVMFAASALGGRVTSLHPLSSAEDMAYILTDSEASVFVYNPAQFEDAAARTLELLGAKPEVYALGPSDRAADLMALANATRDAHLDCVATASDVVSLGYTSGTTGKPKGIIQPNRSYVEMLKLVVSAWQLPMDDYTFLAATPLSHAGQCFVVPAWMAGGTVVLQHSFKPEAFCRAIEEHRVTATYAVPSMIYALLDSGEPAKHDLSSLRTLVYGSAPMSPSRLAEALEVFGPVFVQMYGQSEAPATVTVLTKEEHDLSRPHVLASCGRPIPGVTVALLDEQDRRVAVGEVGELCVRGPLVTDGYWKQPEATEALFANGWLHTGDMAREDSDGYLYLVDRKKDVIITGGMNVFAREVEDVIAECEGVATVAVIGVPDPKWGEAVKAIVVAKPGSTLDLAAITEHVRARKGPLFAPKSIDLADAIPLTNLGKPDRKALRASYWAELDRNVN